MFHEDEQAEQKGEAMVAHEAEESDEGEEEPDDMEPGYELVLHTDVSYECPSHIVERYTAHTYLSATLLEGYTAALMLVCLLPAAQ